MKDFKIVKDVKYGYFKLDPIPTQEETQRFYQKRYFDLIGEGNRSPAVQRQKVGGEEARLEKEWLNQTFYKDILHIISECTYKKSGRLLDVGCGTGAFLKYAKDNNWDVTGIEPSKDCSVMANKLGVVVYNTSLERFAEDREEMFDAITLLNVLEHVPNPVDILLKAKSLLNSPSSIICISVPNDYSELQINAERKLNKGKWWVAIPDHINYFDFESLQRLIDVVGLEAVYKTTDFPMELFLLMGDDYVGNPNIGTECHKKRRNFELSINDVFRREFYRGLAEMQIGRNCIIFAKAKSGEIK